MTLDSVCKQNLTFEIKLVLKGKKYYISNNKNSMLNNRLCFFVFYFYKKNVLKPFPHVIFRETILILFVFYKKNKLINF